MEKLLSFLKVCFLLLILIITLCFSKQEKTVTSSDGVQINYFETGEGEPCIIFVHGWLGDHTGWNHQVDYFSENHKVVSIDLPGFGETRYNRKNWTMKAFGEDIVVVLNHLNIDNAILVGHSMGSAAILEAARLLPQKINGLVTVDVLQNVERKFTEDQIDQEVERRKELLEKSILGNKSKAELKIALIESLKEYFRWRTNDLLIILKELQIPIYSINSDRKVTNVDMVKKYAPSFKMKIIKDVGHAVMLEAPEEFNKLLEEIIIKVERLTKIE